MTPLEQAMLSQRPWFDRRTAEQLQAPSPMTNEELISAIRNFDRPQAELRSFDPLASDMRQNMLAEALGASRAQRIDEGLAWVDPVSPLIDTMQRQQRGEDITPLDYMLPIAGLAAPTAGKVGARFLDDLARVVPSRAPGWAPLPAQEMAAGLDPATFIGPKARTWNREAAEQAARLLEGGASPEDVWRQTGTWRGPDGMLRQEISDEAMRITGPLTLRGEPRGGVAGQIIDNPELYRAYPELRGLGVTTRTPKEMHFPSGAYTLADGERVPSISIVARTPEQAENIAAHEMQHAVQEIEGFAPGGSPAGYGRTAREEYRRIAGEVEARDVEARLRMTPSERRAQVPGASQGIPAEQQIVITPEGRRLKWTR